MVTVTTPHGPLDLHPVERDRIRIEVGIPMNVDGRSFSLNGVPHSVQAWAHLWTDGAWHLGKEHDRMSQLHEPNLTRRDRYGHGEIGKDPSRSAYEKARPAIEAAVNEWAATDEARLALAEATVAWLKREVQRATEATDKAREAVNEAELDLALVEGNLDDAETELHNLRSELES